MAATTSNEIYTGTDDDRQIVRLTGEGSNAQSPPTITAADGDGKFTPEGRVRRWPGNTFLCHIDPTSRALEALKYIQDASRTGPFADYFAFLPPHSFHMTVFPSVCGDPLGYDGFPEGFERSASLEEITLEYAARIGREAAFEAATITAKESVGGFSVHVDGATKVDQERLLEHRRRLQDLTGLKRADFDDYQFHITLAYLLRWMTREVAKEHMIIVNAASDEVWSDLQNIKLGPIEFCRFDDMTHFECLTLLPDEKGQ
ncbi:DUF1868 domain-containing protein [uncultured Tateyamaria sp.]|uniref:DUF1868 domain-containing protein n=1 Tax=uncultured Tateyamaria sp. TaxID=455651 RepID=UPI00262FAA7C|nr:DUF1868 domain-containing protein [uncultured Tateyamaria sp.]